MALHRPPVAYELMHPAFETDARVKLIYASLFPYQGSNRELVFKILREPAPRRRESAARSAPTRVECRLDAPALDAE